LRKIEAQDPEHYDWLRDNVHNILGLNIAFRIIDGEEAEATLSPTDTNTRKTWTPSLPPSTAMKSESLRSSSSWTLPSLSLAPRHFYDSYTKHPLWIYGYDCYSFFAFTEYDHVSFSNLFHEFSRYYLYHVWDLMRTRSTESAANQALNAYLTWGNNRLKAKNFNPLKGLGSCRN
jgi:hypothetical protein